MQTLKDFIHLTESRTREEEQVLANGSNLKPFKYSGWDINPIVHARARAAERASDIDADAWKKFLRDIFWYFKDKKPKTTTFKFYSKALDISVIAERKDKQKSIMIVTVLPKGTTFAKADTEEVTVEAYSDHGSVLIESVLYEYFEVIVLE